MLFAVAPPDRSSLLDDLPFGDAADQDSPAYFTGLILPVARAIPTNICRHGLS